MKPGNRRIALVVLLAFNTFNLALFVPLLVNDHLRFTYGQTLAHWKSKVFAPNVVFLGDSIAAGGRGFNDPSGINLGTNGLHTFQIAASVNNALAYRPRHIVVMAGTNDAIRGPIDRREIQGHWEQLCAEPRVVVTLAPPTRDPALNVKLDEVNAIARQVCTRLERPVITLDALRGPDGLINPQYTTDGVHLTPAGYRIWRTELRKLGI